MPLAADGLAAQDLGEGQTVKCRESYVLERMWRASEIGCSDCPHRPTCGWPQDPCGAWHHWPPCCRTSPSGPPRNCCHRTQPQSSFCTRLNSASHSLRSVSRSVTEQHRCSNFLKSKHESSSASTRLSLESHKTVLIAINLRMFPLWGAGGKDEQLRSNGV